MKFIARANPFLGGAGYLTPKSQDLLLKGDLQLQWAEDRALGSLNSLLTLFSLSIPHLGLRVLAVG